MRLTLCAALLTALAAGCVPVTEPLGDVTTAEPDKALLGDWIEKGSEATWRVEVPAVKGNPKGLMRVFCPENKQESSLWFFTAKVGKHRYASIVAGDSLWHSFTEEGDFAKWQKQKVKTYWVHVYALDGDELVVVQAGDDTVAEVMKEAKIGSSEKTPFYAPPAGWLAKHLEKNGPEPLFGGPRAKQLTYKRAKK